MVKQRNLYHPLLCSKSQNGANGTYRSIMGNQALAYGLIAAADKADFPFSSVLPHHPRIGYPA